MLEKVEKKVNNFIFLVIAVKFDVLSEKSKVIEVGRAGPNGKARTTYHLKMTNLRPQ